MRNQQALRGAYRLFILQIGIIIVLSAILFVAQDYIAGFSFLIGGLVSVIPNIYFARKLFQHRGARSARKIVTSFYHGEAMKMLMTIALFALVFKFVEIKPLLFFAGFIVAQLIFWVAPLFFNNKQK